jgi:hypothetical protein
VVVAVLLSVLGSNVEATVAPNNRLPDVIPFAINVNTLVSPFLMNRS